MVLVTRCLENTFFKDVFNEITTFDAPKAAKKGSKDKQKAARKQFNSTLRPARKTWVQIRWQVARKPLREGWGGGGGSTRGREGDFVKVQFSTKTMQTAAEVCKLQKVDFCGVPILD